MFYHVFLSNIFSYDINNVDPQIYLYHIYIRIIFLPSGVKFCSRSNSFLQYTDFTMHSLIYIVGVVLMRKENYPEWSQKIKHTLIFNDMWKGFSLGEGDKELEKPTSDKGFAIWENKNRNVYSFIATSINEEVSHHTSPFSNSFKALQKLN